MGVPALMERIEYEFTEGSEDVARALDQVLSRRIQPYVEQYREGRIAAYEFMDIMKREMEKA